MESNKPVTLSELQQVLGQTIRMNRHLQNVWVIAEMSDLRVAGGHCYMELIEKDANGITVAKIRAMIWATNLNPLRRKFYTATGRDIATGMKVMVRGSVNHHNLYGLSFVISDIDPSYTIGDLERLRKEILLRLEKEGILNYNISLQMPPTPQRIAIISAPGAAGYGDFMNQLQLNPDGFKFYPFLFPAIMQGERTSVSVRNALDLVEATIDLWDCVVIIRGGGSTSDLNGFDDYELAKAVATFPLPVVVGIGHERDRNVLDEIACVRCKTPTAVAAYLIDALRIAYSDVLENVRKIAKYSRDRLQGENYRIANLSVALPAVVKTRLLTSEKELSTLSHSLEKNAANVINFHKEKLQKLSHSVAMSSTKSTSLQRERLSMLWVRYENALKNVLLQPTLKLDALEKMIGVLSPESTIRRGYSLTFFNGKVVRSIDQLRLGDEIVTKLPDGEIKSTVE